MGSAGGAGRPAAQSRVLFVCLGNICRSPSAEAVFKDVVARAGVADQFVIDSCGTGGGSSNCYHEGDPADGRMTATARGRDITLTSRSRPLTPSDLAEFDCIVGMDAANLAAIKRAAEHWRTDAAQAGAAGSTSAAPVPADYASKLCLMTDFLTSDRFRQYREVPDPYYGGQQGFDLVLDLLDDACQGLLHSIQAGQR
ncbi:putative low molecular weight protein-tyrosine-phosphatase [Chlorella vulgaris]